MKHSFSGNWRYSTEDNVNFASPDLNDSNWLSMVIPRNWFLGGLDHHGVVWFRYEFEYKHSDERPHQTLHFDGVDYFCDVYLNGVLLGHHEGYFDSFDFDVTETIKPGTNLLALRVNSPYETPGPDGWHMHKRLIKGVLNHHDMRPGGAWDEFGQSYNTGGIWNRVFLETHGAVTVETVLLQAQLETASPTLRAEIRVRNRSSKLETNLRVECVPENFSGRGYNTELMVTIPEGESVHVVEVDVPGVSRWQPWDRGFQHLYRISVDLIYSDFTTFFGFRTVQVDGKYNWYINGERYFLRGSNYLASQWLSELIFPEIAFEKNHPFGGRRDPTPFISDVGLMKQANLNIIRVHAHVLPHEFHDACDRAGIMVWQDFPLQWGYSDEPAFQTEAERQGRAMVEMLYNHPSVIAWCMHNESPWSATWMAGQAGGTYNPMHNNQLDEQLEKVARQLDPTRHVHKNSGSGDGHTYPGWYHGYWQGYVDLPATPFCTEYGAQGLPPKESLLKMFEKLGPDAGYRDLMRLKQWLEQSENISLKTRLFIKIQEPALRFAKKFKLEGLRSWLTGYGVKMEVSPYRRLHNQSELPADLQPAYDAWEKWRFHNFQPSENFEPGRIETGESLDEFIANSQHYQANIVQFGTETFRRSKFSKVSGIFQFNFSDPWPAITWSVVDYWRKPKPALDALRWAMQPVLPTLGLPLYIEAGKTVIANLKIVNDLTSSFSGAKVEWRVESNETSLVRGEWTVNIPANDVSASRAVGLPFKEPGNYKVVVEIHTGDGKLLGENIYQMKAA